LRGELFLAARTFGSRTAPRLKALALRMGGAKRRANIVRRGTCQQSPVNHHNSALRLQPRSHHMGTLRRLARQAAKGRRRQFGAPSQAQAALPPVRAVRGRVPAPPQVPMPFWHGLAP